MGCFSSKEINSSGSISTSAGKQQQKNQQGDSTNTNNNGFKEKTKTNPIYKILLLGAGESGKSTIVKQMKIIHQNGYSLDELALYRTSIYRNLLDACHAVLEGMHHLALEPSPDNAQLYAYLLSANVDSNTNEPLDPKIVRAAAALYQDPVYQQIITHDSEFYIMDSTSYFLQNVERIGEPDYIPSETDILRARIKTTGVYETEFSMGSITIHLVDVGGQRSERKKWIHFFDNVTSIIFCVALSEYDQGLLEKNGQNRMQESLVLFESIVNSRWFARTSIILFLNKIDIFKEKILRSPMDKYFPDYTGGSDVKLATKYILYRFSQANHSGLNLYPHLTQATDTSNIRLVFAAVKETILQNALRDSGIL